LHGSKKVLLCLWQVAYHYCNNMFAEIPNEQDDVACGFCSIYFLLDVHLFREVIFARF
jgi:hypothetical protein